MSRVTVEIPTPALQVRVFTGQMHAALPDQGMLPYTTWTFTLVADSFDDDLAGHVVFTRRYVEIYEPGASAALQRAWQDALFDRQERDSRTRPELPAFEPVDHEIEAHRSFNREWGSRLAAVLGVQG